MTRKDFAQNAFDVMRQATGQMPKQAAPAPKPAKQTAPKGARGTAKKSAKKSG